MTHISNTKFLGIVIKNSLFWKLQTQQTVPKLSASCCTIRFVPRCITWHIANGFLLFLFLFQ